MMVIIVTFIYKNKKLVCREWIVWWDTEYRYKTFESDDKILLHMSEAQCNIFSSQ